MATGYTNVAALNSLYNNIIADAWFVARANNIMANLVTVFNDQTGDQTRTSVTYPQFSAQTVTESQDFSNPSQFTKTADSVLTPAEIMAQVLITDRRIETDSQSVRSDASRELGMALADKMETDQLSDFSSFTGGTVGASGSTISWGYFFAARTTLRGAKVPEPYVCVLHEYQWHTLAKALAPAQTVVMNPTWMEDEISRRWYVGSVAGVDIFTTANGTLSGTDFYGGMYNRAALALDMRRAPRLEPERDASKRAWELNVTAKYAHGVWRPAFGCTMYFACSAPTS